MSQSALIQSNDGTGADFDALRGLVNRRLDELVPLRGEPSRAARHSLLAPGKRLRAILCLLTAKHCNGVVSSVVDIACAVEMVHTASLMFDDLPAMDDAALRRGVPTSHVLFGEDVAILGGIGLLNSAFGVVSRSEAVPESRRLAIVNVLSDAVGWTGLVGGQALDLKSSASAAAQEMVAAIHDGKTGVLFVAACLAGAEAAGADCSLHEPLTNYARSLGLAYQALDDVIDQVADENLTGKTTGRDGDKLTAITAEGTGRSLDAARRAAEQHLDAARSAISADASGAELRALIDAIGSHFNRLLEPA
jgi:geranylgeranyl diphosphate synthase type II